jgi:hypothetical protein
MGHIKEPTGVDLFVSPMPLTDDDRQIVSAVISHFKKTGEILLDLPKRKRIYKRKTTNISQSLKKKKVTLAA